MIARKYIRLGQVVAACGLLALSAVAVRGAASSTNFDLNDEGAALAGGDAFSTTFAHAGMIPGTPAGPDSLSTNYVVNTDFVPDNYQPVDTTAPVITAVPVAIYVSDDRALIEWTTDEPATGIVEFGPTITYGSSQAHAGFTTLHQVLITGLAASTLYNYRVSSSDPYFNGPTQSSNAFFITNVSPDATAPGLAIIASAQSIDTLRVDFTASEAADSVFEWGLTGALGTVLSDPAFRLSHMRLVAGLVPGSQVFFAITLTDPSGNSSTSSVQSFTMPLAVTILTATLPDGAEGQAYNQTLAATGGVAPLAWAITSGALPAGLVMDPGTGTIFGTPTGAGLSTFDVQATDAGTNPSSDVVTLSINVSAKPPKDNDDDGGCSTSSGSSQWHLLALLLGIIAIAWRMPKVR